MKQLHIRNRHFFTSDIILLTLAAYLSFVLRLEDRELGSYRTGFVLFTSLALVITPLSFQVGGVYSRYWRYASVEELFLLARCLTVAVVLTSMLSLGGAALLGYTIIIPRSIPFIFLLLALAATASPRLAIRLETYNERRHRASARRRPVLVMGAGDAGRMIVREMRQNVQLGMEVVGLLDDDPKKHGMHIHGVPVLGNRYSIPQLVHEYSVERVIIAMPTLPGKAVREIVSICEAAGVQTKTIPGIYELLGDRVSVNQLRNIEIEDLLRRAPVQTDIAAVRELVEGKRVLITGGGGSIGSELCRQVLRCEPAELIVVGHGENSVFEIQNELRKQSGKVTAVIADIRFPDRIRTVFEEYRPEIVFHAAAHKHVPLMELNPAEAITNNVLGTSNLLDAALAVDVNRFVMISSDKAVNPTSIMGASKRAAELLVHQAARISGKPYVAVRFGNVLGSRGSVVLTFKQQIASGGPVTITHPDMTRYFMTIPEAVQLVLQATVLGQGGEVFMLEMGEPVKIVDLAHDIIKLSGLEVGHDIDIVFTGLRPGEKLFEELFVPGEVYQATCHEKIFVAGSTKSLGRSSLNQAIAELVYAAQRNDRTAIVRCLQNLVPQFKPAQEQGSGQMQREVAAATPLANLSLRVASDKS